MWNNTRITRKLSIETPIIQAGMAGGITTPELVAAVSNAGALGMIGAGYLSTEKLDKEIQEIRQLTTKPFGVNVFVPENSIISMEKIKNSNEWLDSIRIQLGIKTNNMIPQINNSVMDEQIQILLKHKVPVCSFTFGIPRKEIIHELKKNNIITIGTATTVKEAVLNEEAGVDMIVVQGSEAGGHRGSFEESFEKSMIGITALIPQVADNVSIPIIAAGGIMDGRGILSSFILGAEAVQMGTAFLTCVESGANKLHKEKILSATEEELVITSAFSGKPARGIINKFIVSMKEHEEDLPDYPIQNSLTNDIRKESAKQNNPEWMSLWCGQNPRASKNVHATELIEIIKGQVETKISDFQLINK